ncbi:PAS domain-containing hybrid sensor histidine kinase/response regulator [Neorhizobium sp. NPDC001467]|uniref:PAS domain-containing hybrid sensor histidine kinase/response regulator n=1 Tax=Neorhizobium sp. NPDC001467 TaxID=3390595 RepID=UPI003D04D469
MLPGWAILLAACAYILLLFAVATYGDRRSGGVGRNGRPIVYGLSLAVYCTSWTYFGGVGLASSHGLEFAGIYVGPIIAFTFGLPIIRRIIEIAKAERLVSVADFVAARYGKNQTVALIVAIISLVGVIPYIALQLRAVSGSVAAMLDPGRFGGIGFDGNAFIGGAILPGPIDLALIVTLMMACFSVMFGTRHTDATEHQDGLILAIGAESLVKLVAFCTAGIAVLFFLFDGPADLWVQASAHPDVTAAMQHRTPASRWAVLVLLSAFAIILLPRQFHVTVVENRTMRELRMAGWLLPLYLIAINLFVLPVAAAGVILLGGAGEPDLYLLLLPLTQQLPVVSLIVFIGGFSAATAMVIVESVALSIMVSNDILMPVLLRRRLTGPHDQRADFAPVLLRIRRLAIFAVLICGYGYYRLSDGQSGLASIGLLSFAAIAQMAPSVMGGLWWHRANARGAIAGMTVGFLSWAYLLFVPSLGGPDNAQLASAVLDFLVPGTSIFSGPRADPLVNAVALSLLLNLAAFVLGSLSRNPRPLERVQAGVFVRRQPRSQLVSRGWKTAVTIGMLKTTIGRYLGEERMRRSFASHERVTGRKLSDADAADMAVIHFSEQLLGSAIGSASARLVLSLVLQKAEDAGPDTAWLLDQASEALQHNQDMLQTALSKMDQGIAVFDSDGRLTVWNRRFRTLLDLPEEVGQVGYPLASAISILVDRGDLDPGEHAALIARFKTLDIPFSLALGKTRRIVEIRSNAMPDHGFVATFTDMTDRVSAARALQEANETLELRVSQRTAELTHVNDALTAARAAADDANLGKTRFFAAAGHDILQPLNAARLYASALVGRLGQTENSELAGNIDSALESVETILGAVLDISRLDTGAMKPQLAPVALGDLLHRIETDFAPLAREKNLTFTVMPTTLCVRSDANLLRRLVQNLVSNAIKYTVTGKVLVGVRRRGGDVVIEVADSGIGIPQGSFEMIFQEFTRLDEGARTASGLGLGLSIVERISKVLAHPVEIVSSPGRGTVFRVRVPKTDAATSAAPAPVVASPQSLGGITVLCIDNDPRILAGMNILISSWGCTVIQAGSVAQAMALVDDVHSAAGAPVPDLVIADYHLDDGTGIAAILGLRARFDRDIPALVLTADRSQEVRDETKTHGLGLQNKPVKPAALRAYIAQIASHRRAAAE